MAETDSLHRALAHQVESRGVATPEILEALAGVDRSTFLPAELAEQAWEDVTRILPGGVMMPRLFVLAAWLRALEVGPKHRVLLIGVDSGYVLTVLARLAASVHAIDDNDSYERFEEAIVQVGGLENVEVRTGSGEEGWPEAAPFDRILVTRPFREVPEALVEQLAPGGVALMPLGPDWSHLFLERVVRRDDGTIAREHLTARDIVPRPTHLPRVEEPRTPEAEIVEAVRAAAIPFDDIAGFDLDGLLERIGDARVVLLGEASHGTSEFYRMRAAITRALIERKGFTIVGFEADWPDMERVNDWVTGREDGPLTVPFLRFPRWMWRNAEFLEFVDWLRARNGEARQAGAPEAQLYGLDLYGLENAAVHLLDYLGRRDPDIARSVRERLACITPWFGDPATYGQLVLSGRIDACEREVTEALMTLLRERERLNHSPAYFHAVRNATVVTDAERYYKVMYYGGADSWNLRDMHMFQTLRSLLSYHGPQARAVVWAHNSHVGNAVATEMYARGEINIGHLCREAFGPGCYAIGFGTHSGTVAAADNWGEPMRIKAVNPSLPGSYERICHATEIPRFALPLRVPVAEDRLIAMLSEPKLERAIGVIYRPDTERQSHYFQAALPSQFDELIWFDESQAVRALDEDPGLPELVAPHPFAALDE